MTGIFITNKENTAITASMLKMEVMLLLAKELPSVVSPLECYGQSYPVTSVHHNDIIIIGVQDK